MDETVPQIETPEQSAAVVNANLLAMGSRGLKPAEVRPAPTCIICGHPTAPANSHCDACRAVLGHSRAVQA